MISIINVEIEGQVQLQFIRRADNSLMAIKIKRATFTYYDAIKTITICITLSLMCLEYQ